MSFHNSHGSLQSLLSDMAKQQMDNISGCPYALMGMGAAGVVGMEQQWYRQAGLGVWPIPSLDRWTDDQLAEELLRRMAKKGLA